MKSADADKPVHSFDQAMTLEDFRAYTRDLPGDTPIRATVILGGAGSYDALMDQIDYTNGSLTLVGEED